MPNFRGSTGYGKKFLNAGNKQWGEKMQDDVTWGVKYLVSQGSRRPEAGRDHGRLVRRLRDARRRRLHARPLRGGGRHRRPVEPDHAARVDPAVLGGGPDHLPRADGQSEDARGQGSAREAVAAPLRAEDQDAAARRPGRERPAREEGRGRADRDRAARSRLPRRVHPRPRRGPRLRAPGQQHGAVGGVREVLREAPRRPRAAGHDAGGRRAAQGDHGRPEDRRAHEEGGGLRRGRPEARRHPGRGQRELPGEDRGQRPDDPDAGHPRDQGGERHLGRHRDRADADGTDDATRRCSTTARWRRASAR